MLKKHPRGLIYIFFMEICERGGFFLLMAILVLYMDKVLGWPDSKKATYYGVFLALCYFVPLLGGWIGDRVLGQLNSVRISAVLMAFGYVGIALSSASQLTSFYVGLLFVAFGTGIFKVNQSVLTGNLYINKTYLKDAGFNIFNMGVNGGAAIGPLLATFISAMFGSYNISFWVCAASLVFTIIIFQFAKEHLAHADNRIAARLVSKETSISGKPSMDRAEERQRIVTLIILFLIVIFFWLAFYQNGFALTLFAERSTKPFKYLRPETYQFFVPFFFLILTPLVLTLFSRLQQRGKEPSAPVKIFLGLVVMSLSMIVMVFASLAGGNKDTNILSPAWLIGAYLIVTLAEILILPIGMSFVSKVAPPKLQGMMMGGWFATLATGSYGSGFLGKYYSDFSHHIYFLILTGLLAVSAVLILVFLKRLNRFSV